MMMVAMIVLMMMRMLMMAMMMMMMIVYYVLMTVYDSSRLFNAFLFHNSNNVELIRCSLMLMMMAFF